MWSNAPQIEHFVDWRQLRLESLETVGRLAYDDGTLYVAMECFDPSRKRGQDSFACKVRRMLRTNES